MVEQLGKVDIPFAEGRHEPDMGHRHDGLTFTYPTVGIPVPGKTYNSTRVKPQDLAKFDQ